MKSAIAKFLGQVAPVDFDDNFKFKTEINDYLKKYEIKDPIRISIEGYGEVLKPYKNEFAFSDFISDSFKEVCFKEFYDSDNNLLAICWYLDHDYLGFIPKSNGITGFRLRNGNIQIGDETMTSQFLVNQDFLDGLLAIYM